MTALIIILFLIGIIAVAVVICSSILTKRKENERNENRD